MTENEDIEKRNEGPIANIRYFLANVDVKSRLEDILGKRASAFGNSIVNVVSGSKQLQNVAKNNPGSIMRAAMKAATMNLAIDPALGQAAIVPYGNEAVFQVMYRGWIQLCIRSGKYATIHCSEVYADELKSHNPITGEVVFNDVSDFKLRYQDNADKHVIGHYLYFRLTTGFEISGYMSHKEVLAHAKKYSKAYQYDLKSSKGTSAWSTNPIQMGNKTIIIRLLKLYGIMSLDMQDALVSDRETFEEAQANATKRIESEQGSKVIDTDFESGPPVDPEKAAADKAKAEEEKKKLKAKRDAKKAEAEQKKDKDRKPKYHCPSCKPPHDFDEKGNEVAGNMKGGSLQCPQCLNWNVTINDQPIDPDIHEDNN